MIEVHDGSANVESGNNGDQIEETERNNGQEYPRRPLEMRDCSIAKEGDVNVVTGGEQPKRVAKESGQEVVLTDEVGVEKQLKNVQDDQSRKEGIQVDIEAEAPFYVFRCRCPPYHKLVCNEPENSGNDDADCNEVNQNDPRDKQQE